MATLKQIADQTNVSITTVSRVLNEDPTLSVSDAVRKKIIKTARDLKYRIPRKRVKFKPRKEVTIALVYWYDIQKEIDDLYYTQVRKGIEEFAATANIKITIVYKKKGGYERKDFKSPDGLICVGKFSPEEVKYFASITPKIVFVDYSPKVTRYDSVVIDFKRSLRKVIEFLIWKGYEKIGYIGGVEYVNKEIFLGERRERYFKKYLQAKGKLDASYLHLGGFTFDSGYITMKKILKGKKRAEVYVCANDTIAFGAMKAIREHGLKIPDDIGIMGFNDIPKAKTSSPPLSSMHVNMEFMGEQALNSVLELIEGRNIAIQKVIPTKVINRGTLRK